MATPAAKEVDPAYLPFTSPWQVEAKDITCLRYLKGEENIGAAPARIGLQTVLSIIAGTLPFTRDYVEEQLRSGRMAWSKCARYVIDPEQLAAAGVRKAA